MDAARRADDPTCTAGSYDRVVQIRNGKARWTDVVEFDKSKLATPLGWSRPRRIFVNSMSDLFHERLTNEQIAAVFGVMSASHQHTFQVLTKRARRMREWFQWIGSQATTGDAGPSWNGAALTCARRAFDYLEWNPRLNGEGDHRVWPLPNVWVGVSVENQAAADERIPDLLATPAAVRFLSCEPLLGAIQLKPFTVASGTYCHDCGGAGVRIDEDGCCATCGADAAWYGVDWVIAGCESGPGARPCDVAWLRSLRDTAGAAGVPFFLKQASSALVPSLDPDGWYSAKGPIRFGPGSKRKAGGIIELPYLDGVQHAAFPGRA